MPFTLHNFDLRKCINAHFSGLNTICPPIHLNFQLIYALLFLQTTCCAIYDSTNSCVKCKCTIQTPHILSQVTYILQTTTITDPHGAPLFPHSQSEITHLPSPSNQPANLDSVHQHTLDSCELYATTFQAGLCQKPYLHPFQMLLTKN